LTIAVIGATGKLGRSLMQFPNTIACPIRFEDADHFEQWFEQNADVDTVWHVARSCRSEGIRRDHKTFLLEQSAMDKLLESRARKCRFVYASTKVVYGLTSDEFTPLPVHTIAEYFVDDKKGLVNCPTWKNKSQISINNISSEHLIYAITKLACESLVANKCLNYKIIRIWDIL
jgi:nucleoside-diphosphate-sugar epimerase